METTRQKLIRQPADLKSKSYKLKAVAMCFVAVVAFAFLLTPTSAVYAQQCWCASDAKSCPECPANFKCAGSSCSGGSCVPGQCVTADSLIAQPPITFDSPTGTKTFSDIVCKVIEFFSKTILPPIAVLMMLVVGFLFMMGGQMPQKAIAARKTLLYVIAGVILLLLAPGILAIVADITGSSIVGPCPSIPMTMDSIVKAIAKLVNWFAWFVSITSVVMGLYAGALYLTARGDSSQVLKATKVFSYTIIGIAVAVVSFSIIILTKTFFGL